MKEDSVYLAVIFCFILAASSVHAEVESQHEPMHGQMEEQMFKEADANRDGAISKAEFNAFQSRHFKKNGC